MPIEKEAVDRLRKILDARFAEGDIPDADYEQMLAVLDPIRKEINERFVRQLTTPEISFIERYALAASVMVASEHWSDEDTRRFGVVARDRISQWTRSS